MTQLQKLLQGQDFDPTALRAEVKAHPEEAGETLARLRSVYYTLPAPLQTAERVLDTLINNP